MSAGACSGAQDLDRPAGERRRPLGHQLCRARHGAFPVIRRPSVFRPDPRGVLAGLHSKARGSVRPAAERTLLGERQLRDRAD